MMFVAALGPSGHLFFKGLKVRDAAREVLSVKEGQLRFGHIKPAAMLRRVMLLEALGDASCLGGLSSVQFRIAEAEAEISAAYALMACNRDEIIRDGKDGALSVGLPNTDRLL